MPIRPRPASTATSSARQASAAPAAWIRRECASVWKGRCSWPTDCWRASLVDTGGAQPVAKGLAEDEKGKGKRREVGNDSPIHEGWHRPRGIIQRREWHNLRGRGAENRGSIPFATLPADEDRLCGPKLRKACRGAEDAASRGAHSLLEAPFCRPGPGRAYHLSILPASRWTTKASWQ